MKSFFRRLLVIVPILLLMFSIALSTLLMIFGVWYLISGKYVDEEFADTVFSSIDALIDWADQ